jgi:hypothetical protein
MTASTYPMIVRDAMLSRIKTMPFFSTFKFSTNKAEQIQPEKIPFFGIYFINEDLMPEGDANAGEPRFHSSVLYGFSIIVQNNDGAAAEDILDKAWFLLADMMFRDPSLYLNKDAMIQSYTRGNRTHQFGATGADNSIPIAECRFTLTCDLGVIDFPPYVDDVLSKVHFSTNYPDPANTDTTQIQQVVAEWNLPTEKEKEDESVSEE